MVGYTLHSQIIQCLMLAKKYKVEDKQVIVREKSTILYLTQAFENFLHVNTKHALNDN